MPGTVPARSASRSPAITPTNYRVRHGSTNKELDVKPSFVAGGHYSAYVEVRRLKRMSDLDGATELLLRLVDATEAEAAAEGESCGVDPWYYEQLAMIYRKKKQSADELAILERYERQAKAPGTVPERLAKRLAGLRPKADE